MMPMLRFFRHGDGTFALFNGMSGTPTDLIATLLAYDDTHGTPMANMPHTGYQRLDAGAMTIIMDTGAPPPPSVSQDAHAGCLSFELSSGPSRIVTNCGMPATGRDNWRAFARDTPAHSTLTYHGTSSLPVRRTVGDEAAAAGRADRHRPGQCRKFSRGGARTACC